MQFIASCHVISHVTRLNTGSSFSNKVEIYQSHKCAMITLTLQTSLQLRLMGIVLHSPCQNDQSCSTFRLKYSLFFFLIEAVDCSEQSRPTETVHCLEQTVCALQSGYLNIPILMPETPVHLFEGNLNVGMIPRRGVLINSWKTDDNKLAFIFLRPMLMSCNC